MSHIRSKSRWACLHCYNAFISCRLDNCNALLYGIADNQIQRLQSLQNAAARLVTVSRRSEHITPVLRSLHWLPVRQRVTFKLVTLIHKCLNGQAPTIWLTSVVRLATVAPEWDLRRPGYSACRARDPYTRQIICCRRVKHLEQLASCHTRSVTVQSRFQETAKDSSVSITIAALVRLNWHLRLTYLLTYIASCRF